MIAANDTINVAKTKVKAAEEKGAVEATPQTKKPNKVESKNEVHANK
jgi:hypothetical protein